MNNSSCSCSCAETSSASVRRFRTHSGWPHANIDYVEFVGTEGATVFKNGIRGYCSWDLPETLRWLGNHEIVEISVTPALKPKVRYFQGAGNVWRRKIARPTDIFYLETDGASIHRVVQYNGKERNGCKCWTLDRAVEFVKAGTWAELAEKPVLTRYFKRNENCPWHETISHITCIGDKCTWCHLDGSRVPSDFGTEAFAHDTHFTEVAEEPIVAKPTPKTRWLVIKPGCAGATTFRFVEFIGDIGTYHYADRAQKADMTFAELLDLPHYVEVYERPKIERLEKRWFVQKNVTNPLLAFVSFTDGKGQWHVKDGTTESHTFTPKAYLDDSNFIEVFEEPKLSPVKVFNLNTSEVCDVFYTVTDANTRATNSRSKRYESEEAAIAEATDRVNRGCPRYDAGVYVLKAIKLVKCP